MSTNSTHPNWYEESKDWVKNHVDFTLAMCIVGGIFLLIGLCLGFCIWRYPSYDYPENFERDKRLRGKGLFRGKSGRSKNQVDEERLETETNVESIKDSLGTFERLSRDDSTFQKPTFRLPTPGGAPPPGRLPPLVSFGVVNGSNHSISDNVSLSSKFTEVPKSVSSLRDAEFLDDAILDDVDGLVHRDKSLRWKDGISEVISVGGLSSIQF